MNTDHVKIVKQGAKAIDAWRREHPEMRLDLKDADLKEVNLRGANLFSAKFFGADLSGADLRSAKLKRADLAAANLTSANLSGADLSIAILQTCVVSGTNFEAATFSETILCNIYLSQAKGLREVQHDGPSVIDERTLRKSWPLPDVFLRGVGLSDELIDFARATYGKAIEFYSCFISYSSKDDEFARRLHADLQDNGVRCWFAPEDLRIGDKIRARIDEAIRLHDKLLLILSEDAVNSTWVEDEVESAFEKEDNAKKDGEDRTVLFPIRLDSAVMETDAAWAAAIRRTRHIGDFTAWKDHDAYQNSFERLLRDLKSGATKE